VLLAAVYIGVGFAVSAVLAVGGAQVAAFPGAGPQAVAVYSGAQLVGDLVSAAVIVPLEMLLLVGLLITYTQVRSRNEPSRPPALWTASRS
jgi:hypothetical protein